MNFIIEKTVQFAQVFRSIQLFRELVTALVWVWLCGFVVARAYQPFSEYSHRLISSQLQFCDVIERPNTAVCAPTTPSL